MKINSIKTCITGVLISSMISCDKPALKKSTHPLLTKSTIELVDSFAKKGKKILDDPEYKCFALDTVDLELYMSASMLKHRLNRHMERLMPQTKIGEKVEKKLKLVGKVLYFEDEIVDIMVPNYIEPKAVIDNSYYYSYSWFQAEHIPVKYYGKPNPKLKDKSIIE